MLVPTEIQVCDPFVFTNACCYISGQPGVIADHTPDGFYLSPYSSPKPD